MNLLIVTPIFPPQTGGPSTYIWNLIHQLKSAHHITLICFGVKTKSIPGVKIITIDPSQVALIRQLKLLINIIVHGYPASTIYIQGPLVVGFVASISSRILHKHVLLKYVGDEVWETVRVNYQTKFTLEKFYQSPHPISTRLMIMLEKISFRLTHQIIVPSSYLQLILTKYFRVKPDKIIVIPNATDVSTKTLSKKKYQLIFIGRLVPWKNIDKIITAVHDARNQHPWKLLIVGEGPELTSLKQLSAKLKGSSWLKFTGRQSPSETRNHLCQSAKLLLLSDYEGLSHTLIEAMLTKTAIIASDIPPNREATHGFAQLVQSDNREQLSQAINAPSPFVNQAFSYATKHYSWTNHLKKLQQLL